MNDIRHMWSLTEGSLNTLERLTKQFVEFINDNIEYLCNDLAKSLKPTDTNLLNVRDDMLGELQQLKYLLTLQ